MEDSFSKSRHKKHENNLFKKIHFFETNNERDYTILAIVLIVVIMTTSITILLVCMIEKRTILTNEPVTNDSDKMVTV